MNPKGYLFFLLVFLLVFGLVKACRTDDWSREDTIRQVVDLGLTAIDWQQTQEIAKHPESFHELNPIIGSHPTVHGVNNYFLASAIIKTGISYALPSGKWREAWQYITIGSSATLIANNYNIGIRIQF